MRRLALLLAFVAIDVLAAATGHELAGTSWRLVTFRGGDDRVLLPDPAQGYTVAFAADGTLAARVACNRGSGNWMSSEPGRLALGPLALTKKGCPPDPMQQRFVRDWPHLRSYVLKGTRLYVSLVADGGIYEFERLPTR